jgi:hypothetical protein
MRDNAGSLRHSAGAPIAAIAEPVGTWPSEASAHAPRELIVARPRERRCTGQERPEKIDPRHPCRTDSLKCRLEGKIMARRRNRPTRADRRAQERREQRRVEEDVAATVVDVASRFTCSTGVAQDFADQCEQRIEDLDFDLTCNRLALEMWEPIASDAARPVVALLHEIAAERDRHRQALVELQIRLDEYAQQEIHEHLEPVDKYQELVFRRLFEPDEQLVDATQAT